jgi:septal ring factor EnvC (AmiA/AmiB activator)
MLLLGTSAMATMLTTMMQNQVSAEVQVPQQSAIDDAFTSTEYYQAENNDLPFERRQLSKYVVDPKVLDTRKKIWTLGVMSERVNDVAENVQDLEDDLTQNIPRDAKRWQDIREKIDALNADLDKLQETDISALKELIGEIQNNLQSIQRRLMEVTSQQYVFHEALESLRVFATSEFIKLRQMLSKMQESINEELIALKTKLKDMSIDTTQTSAEQKAMELTIDRIEQEMPTDDLENLEKAIEAFKPLEMDAWKRVEEKSKKSLTPEDFPDTIKNAISEVTAINEVTLANVHTTIENINEVHLQPAEYHASVLESLAKEVGALSLRLAELSTEVHDMEVDLASNEQALESVERNFNTSMVRFNATIAAQETILTEHCTFEAESK